jgi:hypothetical protein
MGRVNVIHILGLEVGEEHNGEVRFQIYLFLKKLQAFKFQFCRRPYWIQGDNVIHACNFLRNEDI